MISDSLLLRGASHRIYGEDAIFSAQLSEHWWAGAVMDGCSSARDSHFMASLLTKLVKKGVRSLVKLEKVNPDLGLEKMHIEAAGTFVMNQVFDDLKRVQKTLMLDRLEILSTLFFTLINTKTKQAYLNMSGDGYYSINGKSVEVDQNNMPDYMGYHTDKNFDDWISNHSEVKVLEKVTELIISTDGIAKFYNRKGESQKDFDSASAFLNEKEKSYKELLEIMERENKLYPFDDVGILKYKL